MLVRLYTALCIFRLPLGVVAHPGIAFGIAFGLGSAGPLMLVGMAVVFIVGVGRETVRICRKPLTRRQTAIIIDRSQTTPQYRPPSLPPTHVEPSRPPDEETILEPEDSESADTLSTPTAATNITSLPIGHILPGGGDLDIQLMGTGGASPSSTPKSNIFSLPVKRTPSSRTSDDEADTVVPDSYRADKKYIDAESGQSRDIRPLQSTLNSGLFLGEIGTNEALMAGRAIECPAEAFVPGHPIHRTFSDENKIPEPARNYGDEGWSWNAQLHWPQADIAEDIAESDRSQESSIAGSERSWSTLSVASNTSSVASQRRYTDPDSSCEMIRPPAESLLTDIEIRKGKNAHLKTNVEGFERVIEGH